MSSRPVDHRSTRLLLMLGFTLTTLALLGKAMTSADQGTQFGLSLASVAVGWTGVVLVVVHRRWTRAQQDR